MTLPFLALLLAVSANLPLHELIPDPWFPVQWHLVNETGLAKRQHNTEQAGHDLNVVDLWQEGNADSCRSSVQGLPAQG